MALLYSRTQRHMIHLLSLGPYLKNQELQKVNKIYEILNSNFNLYKIRLVFQNTDTEYVHYDKMKTKTYHRLENVKNTRINTILILSQHQFLEYRNYFSITEM